MACNILASWRPLLSVLFVSVLFSLAFLCSPCACVPFPCGWGAHKSLAPRARTLLGVLGQATLNFVAVTTLLFFVFREGPKFCDLAKQRREFFWGVSEVGKIDFALYFFWLCVFFLVFFFFCCDRATCSLASCPQEKGSKPRVRMLRELLQREGWYGGEA